MKLQRVRLYGFPLVLLSLFLAGCTAPSTPAPISPTAAVVLPTATATAVRPTVTIAPPTSSAVPPTVTPIPPTSTAALPTVTATAVRPTVTIAPPTSSAVPPTVTPIPPTAVSVPAASPATANPACPAWFAFPEPGKGLLVIENDAGVDLLIDAMAPLNWTKIIPAKKDDIPGRLVLQLAPGHYEFRDNEVGTRWRGSITVDLQAGQMLVSPTWRNNFYKELVYPLEVPDGCR